MSATMTRPDAIPPRARLVARWAAAGRDACMVACGFLVLTSTPPSLAQFDGGKVGSVAWAMMLLLGGLVSIAGIVKHDRIWEAAGCSMVGVGFFVWAVAAMTQTGASTVSYALALVFLAGTCGQVYRVVMIASSRPGRVR